MSGETLVNLTGNLTGDPELRFTPNGVAVASFTVASTAREFDKTANAWKDGGTLFLRVSVWREQAEHVAESLVKGDRVTVAGRLEQRSYETKEGEKRTVYEVQADEVSASLRHATAVIRKATRSSTEGKHGAPALTLAATGTDGAAPSF